MLVCGVQRCVHAEVYADSVAHELLAVKGLADCYGGFDVEEGDNDAAEGLERSPCVHFCMLINRFADFCKRVELEDFWCEEILQVVLVVAQEIVAAVTYCDYEGIGGRRWLNQRWQIGKVERKWRLGSRGRSRALW